MLLYPDRALAGAGHRWSSRRLRFCSLSQGGEFAFVIFAARRRCQYPGHAARAQSAGPSLVTLSMVMTPLLLLSGRLVRQGKRRGNREPDFHELPANHGHVVVAGFGRVGQIVGRVLDAKGIPYTALDDDPDQVQLVNQFGNKSYFGDASRLSILEAAETGKARAFVLAIDDIDASLKTAQLMRMHFPHVPIYARARNRRHVHQLMDLGVQQIKRETFLSSLALTQNVLRGLGLSEARSALPRRPSRSTTRRGFTRITRTIPIRKGWSHYRCSARRSLPRSSRRIGRWRRGKKPGGRRKKGRRMRRPQRRAGSRRRFQQSSPRESPVRKRRRWTDAFSTGTTGLPLPVGEGQGEHL